MGAKFQIILGKYAGQSCIKIGKAYGFMMIEVRLDSTGEHVYVQMTEVVAA